MTKVLWDIFQEEVFKICTIYLNDVCVMGTSFQDQLNNQERIFKKMDEHNLRLNTKKCKFFTRNAQQLSHVIQNGEVRPAEESVEAYKNMKSPKTIKDVRAPLSSFSYYRKFMKNFTRISKPINELIRGVNDKAKNTKVNWTPECGSAAQELRNCICSKDQYYSYSTQNKKHTSTMTHPHTPWEQYYCRNAKMDSCTQSPSILNDFLNEEDICHHTI